VKLTESGIMHYRLPTALLQSTRWTFNQVVLSVTSGFCWTVNSHLSIK